MEYVGIACVGDDPPCRLDGLVTLTRLLIDRVHLAHATVDGFSDCQELPPRAFEALVGLERVAADRHEIDAATSRWYRWLREHGPTTMGVEVDLRSQRRWLVEEFAPYSIHAELRDTDGLVELVLHDSGTGVSISTDLAEHDDVVVQVLSDLEVKVERK